MPSRKEQARADLVDATAQRKAAEDRAVKKRQKQFRKCLKAAEAGLTYREIHDITGLSEIRVSQILRDERERREGRRGSR